MGKTIALNGQTVTQHCRYCGRPVKQKAGRGRPKEVHFNCSVIDSRINEIERRMKDVKWQDESKVKAMKGRLMNLNNNCFNNKKEIVYAPDSDEEI